MHASELAQLQRTTSHQRTTLRPTAPGWLRSGGSVQGSPCLRRSAQKMRGTSLCLAIAAVLRPSCKVQPPARSCRHRQGSAAQGSAGQGSGAPCVTLPGAACHLSLNAPGLASRVGTAAQQRTEVELQVLLICGHPPQRLQAAPQRTHPCRAGDAHEAAVRWRRIFRMPCPAPFSWRVGGAPNLLQSNSQ